MKRIFMWFLPALVLCIFFASIVLAGELEDRLFSAAKSGDVTSVQALLEKGVDANAKNKYGYTALRYVINVIENGKSEFNKYTPLTPAEKEGYEEIVTMLKKAASATWADELNKIFLEAAWRGKVDVARDLIDRGADVNTKNPNGTTILINVTFDGYIDMVRLLLDKGANMEERDKSGVTALLSAVARGHSKVAKLLIDRGASIEAYDKYGNTALIFAVTNRNVTLVRTLLDKGANVNAKDIDGHTALRIAYINDDPVIMQMLEQAGGK